MNDDSKQYYLPHMKYGITYTNCESMCDVLDLLNSISEKYHSSYITNLQDFFFASKVYFKWSYDIYIPNTDEYLEIFIKRTQGKIILKFINEFKNNENENFDDFFIALMKYYQILNDYVVFCSLYLSEYDFYEPNYLLSYTYNSDNEIYIKNLLLNIKQNDNKIKLINLLNENDTFSIIYDIIVQIEEEISNYKILLKSDFKLVDYGKFDINDSINYYLKQS
jgi:hypothetical protein